MRAVTVEEHGGPEVLQISDIPAPTSTEGNLLVKVEAAGLNFIDTYHRSGLYPMELPITLGLEGAGTVVETGPGVAAFSPGDRVAWANALGSYAELNLVPAKDAVLLPDSVDTSTAAAVMLQGITAHYLARDTVALQPGHVCLIHAGAGGVGLLLIQMAKMAGATVYTTVGTQHKADLAHAAGADQVIVYTETDFGEFIESEIGPNGLDVVYDGVGAATFDKGLDLLRPRGTMVTFGNASGAPRDISPLELMRKGSLYLTRPTMFDYLQTRVELEERASEVFKWAGDGSLTVTIGAEFELEHAADAHSRLESRQTVGKVLLRP